MKQTKTKKKAGYESSGLDRAIDRIHKAKEGSKKDEAADRAAKAMRRKGMAPGSIIEAMRAKLKRAGAKNK